MNIGHIAGMCLSFLRSVSYLQATFIGLLLLSFTIASAKVLFSWVKTSWFEKKIIVRKLPKFIQDLSLRHRLKNKIIVFQNSRAMAFCLGIKNPRIYLSTKLIDVMNKKEIEAIILHEKYHLINRDIFLILLATFLNGFFFFFPMITDILASVVRQKETDADRYSITYSKNPNIVLSAFKKLLSGRSTNIPSLAYLVSFVHIDTLEHRIKILKGERTFVLSFKVKHILLSFFSLIAIASFVFLSSQPTFANQNVSPSVCLKGHNCHVECSS